MFWVSHGNRLRRDFPVFLVRKEEKEGSARERGENRVEWKRALRVRRRGRAEQERAEGGSGSTRLL